MKVVVTGASGKAGRAIVRDLVEHGHDVLGVDLATPRERSAPSLAADLTELGQTMECLAGADAVVHMAAIPASGIRTEETTFRTNMLSTYNVFEAARVLGLGRVVWASSETIFGLPFEREQPAYAPLDEDHPPYPESSYALSEHFIVAAADTVMDRPSRELMAEVYPSVLYQPTGGEFDSLLSIEKARQLLGYEPQHSWRDHVTEVSTEAGNG